MQPLEGVTVVTLEQAVAAPFATRQLADLGARVIKIERPGVGDFARAYDQRVNGLSSHFVWLNRSKESLTLDVKRPESKDVLDRLLQGADVFVQNLAPGAVERLGLDTGTLRQRYPRLIVCGISGYGTTGPFRDRKAYDLLVQAESGLVSITGSETEPAKSAIAVADIAAGMYGFTSVLTALIARGRSGTGTTIEVSMLEALGEWMGYPLYYTTYGGSPLPRTGARHAAIAPYGPFAVSAGDVVYLGLQNEREWVAFCDQVLCRPELARDARFDSNPQRIQHLEALHAADRRGSWRIVDERGLASTRPGRHRVCEPQYSRTVRRAPPADRPAPVAGGRYADRTGAGPVATVYDRRSGTPDGPDPRDRGAHRRHSPGARLRCSDRGRVAYRRSRVRKGVA